MLDPGTLRADAIETRIQARLPNLVLRIEFDALLRNLSALIGREVDRNLAFSEADVHLPALGALRRGVFQFASGLNERGAFFSELAATEFERMVIMKFLMFHRHNFTYLLQREPLARRYPPSRSSKSSSKPIRTIRSIFRQWQSWRTSVRRSVPAVQAGSRVHACGLRQAGAAQPRA